jgi:hypothetical protein
MNTSPLVEKLYNAEPEARAAIVAIPDASARTVLKQLAQKPLWDGDLSSKHGRDVLVELGYASRWNGVNFLTQDGFAVLDSLWGLKGYVKE